MKEFIENLYSFQRELLTAIHDNPSKLDNIDGKPVTFDTATYKEALDITANAKSYEEEAENFSESKNKFAFSKVFFKRLTENAKFNMFLFEYVNNSSKTKIVLPEKTKKLVLDLESGVEWFYGIIGTVLLIIAPCLFFMNNTGAVAAGITLAGLFMFCFFIRTIDDHYRAKKMIPTLTSWDVLTKGHDVDYIDSGNKTLVLFKTIPNFETIMNDSIKLKGSIGCIILKNSNVSVGYKYIGGRNDYQLSITIHGNILPVLVLEHSIIFYTEYFDLFTENQFFPLEKKEVLEKLLNELHFTLLV